MARLRGRVRQGATGEVETRDPAASMALIFDAMRHPLDPLYADVAERKKAKGHVARQGRSPFLLISLVLIGLLMGAAAHALRVPTKVAEHRHSQLIGQVEKQQRANDDDERKFTDLRGQISDIQALALSRSSQGGFRDELSAAEQQAGAASVTGSGLIVKLGNPPDADTDSADSDPRTGTAAKAITSADLQQIVNDLWQAGASAIAINDQRVTSLSAIRFAGSAVLVNFRPLTTPYTVRAVGPSSLSQAAQHGSLSAYLEAMRRSSFTVETTSSSNVTIPAVASIRISHATPVK